MNLQETSAFITGAAQGFGKAFTEALLSRGASVCQWSDNDPQILLQVCFCDVQEQKGRELERDLQQKYGKDKVQFVQCDVRSEELFSKAFNEAVSKFGHIGLMVNNAGIGDDTRVKDMIDINLFGVVKGSQFAIEHMRTDQGGKGGVIINVASGAGLVPVYFFPVYAATKHGVVGFTESWASNPHLKEMGLQFACLCPAFADTAILKVCEKTCHHQDELGVFLEHVGVTTVDHVTEAFMQLVDSDNCNGDVITVKKGDGIQYQKKNGESVSTFKA